MIGTLTDAQLAAVGMDPDEVSHGGADFRRGYAAFHAWLTRLLTPLDSGVDLPARRVTNAEHHRQIADRTDEQIEASELARRRLHEVVNAIVASSVDEAAPAGYKATLSRTKRSSTSQGRAMDWAAVARSIGQLPMPVRTTRETGRTTTFSPAPDRRSNSRKPPSASG